MRTYQHNNWLLNRVSPLPSSAINISILNNKFKNGVKLKRNKDETDTVSREREQKNETGREREKEPRAEIKSHTWIRQSTQWV